MRERSTAPASADPRPEQQADHGSGLSTPAPSSMRSLASLASVTSGGTWRLTEDARQGEQLDLRVETAAGAVQIRVTPAVRGGSFYRVLDHLGYSYLTGPGLVEPDYVVFERFIEAVHPTLAAEFLRTEGGTEHLPTEQGHGVPERSDGGPSVEEPPTVVEPDSTMLDDDLRIHSFALQTSGYTTLRGVFLPEHIAALCAEVDRALAAVSRLTGRASELAYTFYDHETYLGVRCMYCWGKTCLELLEHPLIEAVATAVIGPHKLFDITCHSALPAGAFERERLEAWHRDIDVFADSPTSTRYLWFFVCLDDFTTHNGSTWIVPGSQRLPNECVPDKHLGPDRFPTRVQLLGQVGDVIVLNPSAVHAVGHNVTDHPRRMLNMSVCRADVSPILDHWSIAGPSIQGTASERLRRMLDADHDWGVDTTWFPLPPGWQTSNRGHEVTVDPANRIFPREQQGYQRSHRIRT